jgi:hypothetical protein
MIWNFLSLLKRKHWIYKVLTQFQKFIFIQKLFLKKHVMYLDNYKNVFVLFC